MAYSFDKRDKLITAIDPQVKVTVQNLLDTIRDWEDELDNFDTPSIASASGKEDLGGEVYVGITLKLQNGWRLKFEDRDGPDYILCEVTGGNLVAVDEGDVAINPIAPSAYVTVTKTSSSSATIAELEISNLQRLIEAQREDHSGFGNIWYWDPYSGNDGLTGESSEQAVKTFLKIHALASTNNGDIIICENKNPAGSTIVTESLTISKNDLLIRGPGREFIFQPISTTKPVIKITGEGTEISGMQIDSAVSGSENTIELLADEILISQCWINSANNHGIYMNNVSHCRIKNVLIENALGSGIHMYDVDHVTLDDARVSNCINDGIFIDGTNSSSVSIKRDTILNNNGRYGINISSGVSDTYIDSSVTSHNNVIEDINDEGTDTHHGGQAVILRYQGAVHIDVDNGVSGTNFPRGTPDLPVNNIEDALDIISYRNLKTIHICIGTVTVNGSTLSELTIEGENTENSIINFNSGDTDNCTFKSLKLSGINNGSIIASNCTINNLIDIDGSFFQCGFLGTNGLVEGATATFHQCFSQVPGTDSPVLDFNSGKECKANLRSYSGGIRIINFDHPDNVCTIELVAGRVNLTSSCTDGLLVIRGTGQVWGEPNGTTINLDAFVPGEEVQEVHKALWNKKKLSKISDDEYDEILYDDDGVTPIRTHKLTKPSETEEVRTPQ